MPIIVTGPLPALQQEAEKMGERVGADGPVNLVNEKEGNAPKMDSMFSIKR